MAIVGSVAELWRFPVKSMQGEQLLEVEVTARGVVGDRAYLAQEDLPQDTDVLRMLVHHNRMQVGDLGQFPCAGVYAVVAAPGTVRTGDHVTVV